MRGSFQSFPHGTLHYRSIKSYLSLEGGPPLFKQNFSGSVLLFFIFYFDFDTSFLYLNNLFYYCFTFLSFYKNIFLASFAFATPLLTKSLLIYFPLALEMFHFARFFFFLLRALYSFCVINQLTPSKFSPYLLYAL